MRISKKKPHEVKQVALFAPPNCTGNSGVVGDTVLQTSLVRSLLDRSLFPNLQKVHWWGAKSIIDLLFKYSSTQVNTYEWDGKAKSTPSAHSVNSKHMDIALICTRDRIAIDTLKRKLTKLPCYIPDPPLDAQSSNHLCSQLHTCLSLLDVRVTDTPRPRIIINEEEIAEARKSLKPKYLEKLSSEVVQGEQDFYPDYDKIFLVSSSVGAVEDPRTWSRISWKRLVRLLSAVGPVVVVYNPKDNAEKRAAEDIVAGEISFKPRFAVGLNLRELAAWSCVSTVVIARDSGPMHVVSATVGPNGMPQVLGLVSVMHPSTWKPLSDNFHSMGEWPLPLEDCLSPREVAVKASHM